MFLILAEYDLRFTLRPAGTNSIEEIRKSHLGASDEPQTSALESSLADM